ncbi:MAG TPA: biopolymer transporter ExbB, partial [Bacteroidales bacterium]|nr:biopolymer transporter ExbB [Bacteroidales bacterium]
MISGILLQITQPAGVLADTLTTGALQTATTGEIKLSIWELSLKGGWIMLPLALMSLFAIYIFIE